MNSSPKFDHLFTRCPKCQQLECICATRKRLTGAAQAILLAMTAISGAATLWLYANRVTFDEPLFFIAEFIVNLPLVFSFCLVVFLLGLTVSYWLKNVISSR